MTLKMIKQIAFTILFLLAASIAQADTEILVPVTSFDTAGTDVLSSDVVCDTNTQVGSLSSAAVTADQPIALMISAVANSPEVARIHFKYTIDD